MISDEINGFSQDETDNVSEITPIAARPVVISELEDQTFIKEQKRAAFRRQLSVSLLGVFLCTFFGVGFFFSAYSLVKYFISFKNERSGALKWSLILSFIGIFLNIAIFVLFIVYVGTHNPPNNHIE